MSNMRSYETARSLFGFLEIVAWSAVAIGVLAAFAGANAQSGGMFGGNIGIIGAVPGIIIAVLGLFQVAIVQTARATVDTAEYTQQMLKIARDQLDVSKQALKQGHASTVSFSTMTSTKQTEQAKGFTSEKAPVKPELKEEEGPNDIEYNGKLIVSFGSAYHCNGIPFKTIEEAKNYIDNFTSPIPSKLPLPSKKQ